MVVHCWLRIATVVTKSCGGWTDRPTKFSIWTFVTNNHHLRRLFLYYEEVCRKKEERMPKTLLWENAKPSLPGSPCHCHCYAIALRSVAVVAVAVVTLPPAHHAGAASGEKSHSSVFGILSSFFLHTSS